MTTKRKTKTKKSEVLKCYIYVFRVFISREKFPKFPVFK